jgi:signal transduction histidine kinase
VIFAKRDEKSACITVQDFGPGNAEKERGKIFERYERLGQTRNVGGLGLGLYISKQIITAHGGELELKPGKDIGATFVIRLPLDSRTEKVGLNLNVLNSTPQTPNDGVIFN